jgi:hypothetical protein
MHAKKEHRYKQPTLFEMELSGAERAPKKSKKKASVSSVLTEYVTARNARLAKSEKKLKCYPPLAQCPRCKGKARKSTRSGKFCRMYYCLGKCSRGKDNFYFIVEGKCQSKPAKRS